MLLARRHNALVVPWTFVQEGLPSPEDLRYRPLRLLLSRLTAPLGTIYCRRGRASDLQLPEGKCDVRSFKAAVQSYYARSTNLPSRTDKSLSGGQDQADVVTAEAECILEGIVLAVMGWQY